MKLQLIVVTIVILFSSFIKIMTVSGYNFAFTYDQARDMLDLRQIFPGFSPKLVGPTTSINGVLLGPFWYYLNLPAYLFGGGNPAFIVYWQIIIFFASGIVFFLYLNRRDHLLALVFSLFYFLVPIGFETAKYFWNANAMPAFTALFLLALVRAIISKNKFGLFLLGLISGLSLQIEAAFGIFFLPLSLLLLILNKRKPKELILVIEGFSITLVPQLIFELIHGFPMTKIFMAEFFGGGTILGNKIGFAARLADRVNNFRQVAGDAAIGLLAAVYIVRKRSNILLTIIIISSLTLIITSFVSYLFLPLLLKHWYLFGLAIPQALILACLIYIFLKSKLVFQILALLFVTTSVFTSVKTNLNYLNYIKKNPSLDKSNFGNQMKTVDTVYSLAGSRGFKVYNYLASVYDYPYQYLFWWYGTKKYGYQPADIAYLPNQPEYIRNQNKYWKKVKPYETQDPIFLIIETDKEKPWREEQWLSNFKTYCVVNRRVLPWDTKVVELKECDQVAIL